MKKRILKLFSDMIPVILGILIALFINNWKENLDDRKFVNRVLSSIDTEMKDNREAVLEILPRHDTLYDTTQYYLKDSDVDLVDLFQKTNGFQLPFIQNTAWQSFLNSKIELMDYETIRALTSIDETKNLLTLKVNKLMDFVYEKPNDTSPESKMKLSIIIEEISDAEKSLLEELEAYLEQRNIQ